MLSSPHILSFLPRIIINIKNSIYVYVSRSISFSAALDNQNQDRENDSCPKVSPLSLQYAFPFYLYEVHTDVYFVISKPRKLSPKTIPLPLCTVGLSTASPPVTAPAFGMWELVQSGIGRKKNISATSGKPLSKPLGDVPSC